MFNLNFEIFKNSKSVNLLCSASTKSALNWTYFNYYQIFCLYISKNKLNIIFIAINHVFNIFLLCTIFMYKCFLSILTYH